MTIDEHFLFMVLLESLIFFLGIWVMYRGQKKQTDLIEAIVYNPDYAAAVAKNMVFGFMEDITDDEEKEAIFVGFMQRLGINVVMGINAYMQEKHPEMVDKAKQAAMKGLPKGVKTLVKAADFLGIDLKQVGKKVVKENVEEAVGTVPGW